MEGQRAVQDSDPDRIMILLTGFTFHSSSGPNNCQEFTITKINHPIYKTKAGTRLLQGNFQIKLFFTSPPLYFKYHNDTKKIP